MTLQLSCINTLFNETPRIMKKLIMISALLLVGAMSVSAQTYLYKYLYTVDENGVKSQDLNPHVHYYTFSNNKGTVYRSDKDGNLRKTGTPLHLKNTTQTDTYEYIGVDNGILRYKMRDYTEFTWGGIINNVEGEAFLLFSSDYSRMNHKWLSNSVDVYERTTEPEKKNAPTQLY